MEYYDRLMEVRRKGHFEQWIKFFLQAILESSDDAIDKVFKLTALHQENMTQIMEIGRVSQNTMRVFEYIKANPIIEIKKTAQALDISYNTVSTVVKKLMEVGILVQEEKQKRNRTFAYKAYLEILRDGTMNNE